MLIPSILVKYYAQNQRRPIYCALPFRHVIALRALIVIFATAVPLSALSNPCANALHPAQVQGAGAASPIAGERVTVQGVVTLVTPNIGGFFIQAETNGNPNASDGLFIYAPNLTANQGEQIAVTGEVKEFHGLTELTRVERVQFCATAELPAPLLLGPHLKVSEALENMRVKLPETILLDNFQLFRVGELVVGTETQQWRLEDASNQRQLTTLPWGVPQDATLLANGNTVASLIGVLTWRWGQWVILPEHPLQITHQNWHRPEPEHHLLRLVSFNMHNAFNGTAGNFQGSRGARNQSQWVAQRQKLLLTLNMLNADLLVLQELQHDQGLLTPVLTELTTELEEQHQRHYKALAPKRRPDDDAITNAILYDPLKLHTVGPLIQIETRPRPALLQQFKRVDSNEQFWLVAVHMKSRGSNCVLLCKAERSEELALIITELNALDDSNPRILAGDFNTLVKESLWQPLVAQGWQRLTPSEPTYWFRGQAQQIDHFWVTGFTEIPNAWGQPGHAEMPPMGSSHPLYRPDRSWGASDHNPIIMHW